MSKKVLENRKGLELRAHPMGSLHGDSTQTSRPVDMSGEAGWRGEHSHKSG